MDVVLTVRGQVVVDHQRHLLHVDTTGQQIGRDEHTGGTGSKFSHDQITFTLVNGYGENDDNVGLLMYR